jgi:hypothetical protein
MPISRSLVTLHVSHVVGLILKSDRIDDGIEHAAHSAVVGAAIRDEANFAFIHFV